jgi:deoxycytidine triphosphate deaminase
MAVLSDRSIRKLLEEGRIVLDPLDEGCIQPASVDVHLDRLFRVFLNHTMAVIDVKQDLSMLTELVEIDQDGVFVLHPGEFVLGSTSERIGMPDDLVARVEGKALALDTEVPTPAGWTTMGDVAVGDLVVHPTGVSVPVVAATDVLGGRPCFELEFAGGATVVADALHQWPVGRGRIVTTEQMAQLRPLPTVRPNWQRRGARTRPWAASGSVALETRQEHAVVAVRPVPSVPVRCIQVGAPDGQFLITRRFVPTHNSSLGRLGLLIHSTAGFIDPGFDGHITLELSNVANLPITLYPGMKIGQISFLEMTTPADVPYGKGGLGSKYQGQRGPTPSRYWENFTT